MPNNQMKMDARNFFEVIKVNTEAGCSRLHIPAIQRSYKWTEKQIVELIDDFYQMDSAEYFSGAIILVSSENGKAPEVIDGQQRFTTIFLSAFVAYSTIFQKLAKEPHLWMTKAISTIALLQILFEKSSAEAILKEIQDSYSEWVKKIQSQHVDSNTVFEKRIHKILRDSSSKPQILNLTYNEISKNTDLISSALTNFTNNIISAPLPEKTIVSLRDENNYYKGLETILETFKAKISNTEIQTDIESEIERFIKGIVVADIRVKDENFAVKLFEVLNDRGLQLTDLELIKSKILSAFCKGCNDKEERSKIMELTDEYLSDVFSKDNEKFFLDIITSSTFALRKERNLNGNNSLDKNNRSAYLIFKDHYFKHFETSSYGKEQLNYDLKLIGITSVIYSRLYNEELDSFSLHRKLWNSDISSLWASVRLNHKEKRKDIVSYIIATACLTIIKTSIVGKIDIFGKHEFEDLRLEVDKILNQTVNCAQINEDATAATDEIKKLRASGPSLLKICLLSADLNKQISAAKRLLDKSDTDDIFSLLANELPTNPEDSYLFRYNWKKGTTSLFLATWCIIYRHELFMAQAGRRPEEQIPNRLLLKKQHFLDVDHIHPVTHKKKPSNQERYIPKLFLKREDEEALREDLNYIGNLIPLLQDTNRGKKSDKSPIYMHKWLEDCGFGAFKFMSVDILTTLGLPRSEREIEEQLQSNAPEYLNDYAKKLRTNRKNIAARAMQAINDLDKFIEE